MKKDLGLPEEILINLARTEKLDDGDKEQLLSLLSKGLNEKDAAEFLAIIKGKRLPSLASDVIAKKIFDPVEHPDRLSYLLQVSAGEKEIKVSGISKMEGFVEFANSKKLIHDIPAELEDGRTSDIEFQVRAQEFVFPRTELYTADMLLIQYSAKAGEKDKLGYENAKGTLVVMLMCESPSMFRKFDKKSDRYIHRFEEAKADSGLTHKTLSKTVYVQLDKALRQFKKGANGERDERAQLLFSAIKDINNPTVMERMKKDRMFSEILDEVRLMAQKKEVQIMVLAEKYAMMDWITMQHQSEAKGEVRGEARGVARGKAKGKTEGQDALVKAVNMIHRGSSENDLRDAGFDDETINHALLCK